MANMDHTTFKDECSVSHTYPILRMIGGIADLGSVEKKNVYFGAGDVAKWLSNM